VPASAMMMQPSECQ